MRQTLFLPDNLNKVDIEQNEYSCKQLILTL